MHLASRIVRDPIPEFSYASRSHSRLKRWFIRAVEELSGRERYAALYDIWRHEIAPSGDSVFSRMLDLVDIRLSEAGHLPALAPAAGRPLVIVANHPFGIGDGIAALSLAERLGRPFRVMINAELLKIPEMAPLSLPVDFSETKAALKRNLATRHEALRLLTSGVTIVVFPGGGVATAPNGVGKARDLPWKMFPFRLIQEARADVLPLYFAGQNGWLFHVVSGPMHLLERESRLARFVGGLSLTLRTSLLIREFAKLSGREMRVSIGDLLPWPDLEAYRDRKELQAFVKGKVFGLATHTASGSAFARTLPARGRSQSVISAST
ncbi:MAG: 1-acyl-sn-glycerol-3-phosphate acyltransferase [Rhizobiaceae bacterium]|nr:1-acyl-sn-glycerol-3-phosphate acyltransferase [Rhizobiaceae bacterium]